QCTRRPPGLPRPRMDQAAGGQLQRLVRRHALRGSENEEVLPAALEPIVGDTSTVSRQVFEPVQAVKVVDWYPCHGLGFGET
ncbi:MAG: hypothetical protein ACRDHF_08770, partial [Tepidiformaceae bacterium]